VVRFAESGDVASGCSYRGGAAGRYAAPRPPMQEFLDTAFSLPTVLFTGTLGVVLLYWVTVMVGALDLDVLDPGGAADGVDGAMELDADVDLDADGAVGGLAGVLTALRLRHAPVTVTFSVLTLLGWLGSFFGSRYLAPLIPGGAWLPDWSPKSPGVLCPRSWA